MLLLRQKRNELKATKGDLDAEIKSTVEQKLKSFKAILGAKNLTPEDYDEAEKAIIYFVQKQKFKSEIASLKNGSNTVSKDSPLYKLDPLLEEDILKVGGRLHRSTLRNKASRYSF